MPTPRVLHVIASLSPVQGGTTSAVLQMIEALNRCGVACEITASDDDGPGRHLSPDAPERALPERRYFPKIRDFYTLTPALRPWLEANVRRYDLLHIHGLFSHVNALSGRVARRAGVPYVVTPHGMANRYGMRHKRLTKLASFHLLERALLDEAAAVHLTSRGEAHDFAELGVRAPVELIPLAVAPTPQGSAERFFASYPELRARKPLIAFLGRLNPIKNVESLIDACGRLRHAMPEVGVVIAGDGPEDYARSLRQRAEMAGVADRIAWIGFVVRAEKSDMLAAADCFVLPSHSESFGMAAIEAVSAGLPCVLGNGVALAEDLAAAGVAVAVAPTAEGVARGVGDAMAMIEDDFSTRAQRFVAMNYSTDVIGATLAALYDRVAQTRISGRLA